MRSAIDALDFRGRAVAILLGRAVAQAFGVAGHLNGEPYRLHEAAAPRRRGVALAVIPHPSGRNRAWNDPKVRAGTRAGLREMCAGHLDPALLREGAPEFEAALRAREKAEAWRDRYLEVLARAGDVARSAEVAEVSYQQVWHERARDPEFRYREEVALDESLDRAEGEVYRRGKLGYKGKPVIYLERRVEKGEDGKVRELKETKVLNVIEYSDACLFRLLSANRPEKWSERRKFDHAGSDGGPLTLKSLIESARSAAGEAGGEES